MSSHDGNDSRRFGLSVKLTVAEGLGVTAISSHAVEVELAAGTLAVVRLSGWKVRRHLSLVHSRDVPLTPAAQRFVEALRAAWTPANKGGSQG